MVTNHFFKVLYRMGPCLVFKCAGCGIIGYAFADPKYGWMTRAISFGFHHVGRHCDGYLYDTPVVGVDS